MLANSEKANVKNLPVSAEFLALRNRDVQLLKSSLQGLWEYPCAIAL